MNDKIQFELNIDGNKLKIMYVESIFHHKMNYLSNYHYHTEYEIHYIASGSFVFKIADREYFCESKSLLIIPPDVYHISQIKEPGVRVCFQCRILKKDNKTFSFPDSVICLPYVMPEEELIIHTLSAYYQADTAHNLRKLKAVTESIMLNINDSVLSQADPQPSNNAVAVTDPVERTLDFIGGHYGEQINLADVCATMFISERQLTRVLKAGTGYTFSQLLTRYRTNMAKKMILMNEMNLVQIAEAVGFTAYSGFWKAFVNTEGISPTAYKKANVSQTMNSEIKATKNADRYK